MTEKYPPSGPAADALWARAQAGGPDAALAARRAAQLWEPTDPDRARSALLYAAQLTPLDPAPKLDLARLEAEHGDVDAALARAKAVLAETEDHAAQARAAFLIGEIAKARGDTEQARAHFERTLKLEDALLAANRSDPEAARRYARARGRLAELDAGAGQRDRARHGAEAALAMLRAAAAQIGETPILAADIADAEMRLGALELDANQPASARRRLSEAIGRYEALAVTEKQEPHWRALLSDAWALAAEADYVRGAPDRARDAMDKALHARLRLAANDASEAWALAGTWRVRAALRGALGDAEAAAESIMQARALAERLCADAPHDEAPGRFFVHTLLDQTDHALNAGALEAAREAADSARMRAEAFAQAKDAHPAWLGDTAACWDRLGEVAQRAGAREKALEAFARALELRRMACDRAPDDPRFVRGLAAALVKQGDAALAASAHESARAAFNESAGLRLRLLEAAPDDPVAARALAVALERLGLAAQAMGDLSAARAAWEDELALAARIFAPNDLEGFRFCAIVEAHLARAGGADAETHRTSSLARFDELAKSGMLSEQEAALRKSLWSV